MLTLTEALRRELLGARRGGDRAVAAALRATLTALANAEAVAVAHPGAGAPTSGLGAGSTEVPRREVTDAEQVALVHAETGELLEAARTYDEIDPDRAAAAREGARVLERVLAETG